MNKDVQPKKRSLWQDVWNRFKKNKVAVASLIVLVIVFLVAVFAEFIVPYEKAIEHNLNERLTSPNFKHILGTDDFGRSMFARLIHGTRYSIFIALTVMLLSMIFGALIGSFSGYYGGKVDNLIMRMTDVILAFPAILLVITLIALFGIGIPNLILAMTIGSIPGHARMVRASVLSIKDAEFIEASRAIGCNDFIIIFKHILPNVIGPIIINSALSLGGIIMGVASLSFIGFGVKSPTPEWGAIMASGKDFIRTAPYFIIIPGLFIVITTLAITLLGDGLVDALDPRLKN